MAREATSGGTELKALMQAQVAALVAGVALFGHWARAATTYAEEVGDSLARFTEPDVDRSDATASATHACERYLREVGEMPQLYTLRLLSELERIRTRSAADYPGAPDGEDQRRPAHRRMPWEANV